MYLFTYLFAELGSRVSTPSTFGRSLSRISAERSKKLTAIFIVFLSSFANIFTIGQDILFNPSFVNNPIICVSYAVYKRCWIIQKSILIYFYTFICMFRNAEYLPLYRLRNILLLLLEWLYSPCGPSPLYSFLIYSIHSRQDSLNEWSAHRKASTETLDGKWPIILFRGPLGAWGSLTRSKFTARVKQLKVPPGGLVPWIFPSLKIRRPPLGLNPRHLSHEVGTLPLDHGSRYVILLR
jgi:hypothetical protein